jgi:hypothetical protein
MALMLTLTLAFSFDGTLTVIALGGRHTQRTREEGDGKKDRQGERQEGKKAGRVHEEVNASTRRRREEKERRQRKRKREKLGT